jgi:Wiskott-Aldrich syndrome protein
MANDAKLGLVLGVLLVLVIAVLFFRKDSAASVPTAPAAVAPTKKAAQKVTPPTPPRPPAGPPQERPVATPAMDELPKPRPIPASSEEVPALPPPPVP